MIFTKTSGNVQRGLGSRILTKQLFGTGLIHMGVNTSSFCMPKDLKAPAIMVGPSTDVLPILGFLQAREKASTESRARPCIVFFGCRAEQDFLHGKQMRECKAP
jgi:sulfite reductase alpha subunit-like flavoprotein